MPLELCVGCKNFVYFSNKTNFTVSKFIESEFFKKLRITPCCEEFYKHGKL